MHKSTNFAAQNFELYTMAVTRLKRKARRNKLRSKKRLQKMALESTKPVIKNVDIEELKKGFSATPSKAKKAEKEEVKEAKVEAITEAPVKEEKKEEKIAAPKKEAAPKAEKAATKEAPAKKKPIAKKEVKK